jgi:hypothetical protein
MFPAFVCSCFDKPRMAVVSIIWWDSMIDSVLRSETSSKFLSLKLKRLGYPCSLRLAGHSTSTWEVINGNCMIYLLLWSAAFRPFRKAKKKNAVFDSRFQVLTAACMLTNVSCDVVQCTVVEVYWLFRGSSCLHRQCDDQVDGPLRKTTRVHKTGHSPLSSGEYKNVRLYNLLHYATSWRGT